MEIIISVISDYPPDIQEVYYRTQHKEAEKKKLTTLMRIKKAAALIIYMFVFAWMLHIADAQTFFAWLAVSLWIYEFEYIEDGEYRGYRMLTQVKSSEIDNVIKYYDNHLSFSKLPVRTAAYAITCSNPALRKNLCKFNNSDKKRYCGAA